MAKLKKKRPKHKTFKDKKKYKKKQFLVFTKSDYSNFARKLSCFFYNYNL